MQRRFTCAATGWRRWIRRPAISDPVKPIVYYLDPGTPEPIRSALLEGARWWNQAFEAAGYRNAFRVELLPDGVNPLDIRYNMINWVHRSTRGWSSGGAVIDPRTGEIIKGVVTLGSLRVRQDYMIAEGLLSPYKTGTETPPELKEWALARIRQLSAHEVGPHARPRPQLLRQHRRPDLGDGLPAPARDAQARRHARLLEGVYRRHRRVGQGVRSTTATRTSPPARTRRQALARDPRRRVEEGPASTSPTRTSTSIRASISGRTAPTPPPSSTRMMEVRRVALSRFGENAIKLGEPLATIEEVLVPLYLHHRYQVEAAASVLGGQHYIYAMRGDGRVPFTRATAAEQQAALKALMGTLAPSALALPDAILKRMPPRPDGYGMTRELFPRYTGMTFDVITPAVVAATHTLASIFQPERAARLVEQHAVDPSLPGLDEVIGQVGAALVQAAPANPYEAEIARAVQRVAAEQLMGLAASAEMPQVRAIVMARLEEARKSLLNTANSNPDASTGAFAALLARDIGRFLDNPDTFKRPVSAVVPPGAPIGEPGWDWLGLAEPPCSLWDAGPGGIIRR